MKKLSLSGKWRMTGNGFDCIGTVIGVTNKADAKAIGEVYVKSMEGIVTDIECKTHAYYVQIEYALTP